MAETTIDPTRAIQLLNTQIEKANGLLNQPHLIDAEYRRWSRTTLEYATQAFGQSSRNLEELEIWDRQPGFASSDDYDAPEPSLEQQTRNYQSLLQSKVEAVRGFVDQLECKSSLATTTTETFPPPANGKVFLVHGQNLGAKHNVARTLECLGVEVVILDEQANRGQSIIEKIEKNSDVAFAVVILTGDDSGGLATDNPKDYGLRPRQNVIFELGYFIAKLGRGRVCPLYEPGVINPSDFGGVLYIPLDLNGGWRISLARELKAAGFDVDLNALA